MYRGYLNRGETYHGTTFVYYALKDDGVALYIGLTKCVNTRMQQHKKQPWYSMFSHVGYIRCKSRELAKTIETFLIKTHQPIFNTVGK